MLYPLIQFDLKEILKKPDLIRLTNNQKKVFNIESNDQKKEIRGHTRLIK